MRYPITKKQFIAWLKEHPRKKAGTYRDCPIVHAVKEITKQYLPDDAYPTSHGLISEWPFRFASIIDHIKNKYGDLASWGELSRKQVLAALKEAGEL